MERGSSGSNPKNYKDLVEKGYKAYCGAVTSSENVKNKYLNLYVSDDPDGRKSSLNKDKIDPVISVTPIKVPLVTLDELLKKYDLLDVDFISIDVEGHELEVIDTLPVLTNIKLLLIEDWGLNTQLHKTLKCMGYKRVRRTGYNSWYVPKNSTFPLSPFGAWQLFFKLNIRAPFRNFRKKRRVLN